MAITSALYLAFLALVFVLHRIAPRILRGPLLIGASLVFYASWRWEFCLALVGLGLFNWAWARWLLAKKESAALLWLGITVNLAPLAFFKYAGFVVTTLASVVGALGGSWTMTLPALVVPVGISFWTFQGVAYLIDVASGAPPLTGICDFLLYRTFWPQLIAGPIVRVDEVREALAPAATVASGDRKAAARRILFGLFKKIVLANALARHADSVFHATAPGFGDAALGLLAYGTYIYLDFSAYSDIALGSARLFGFPFPENFDFPYGANSPQAFWRRWHMSLSRWIQDYLYTPMVFAARRRASLQPLCVVAAMAICGLWHGAAWTFVVWGTWHGLWLALNQGPLRRFFGMPAPKSAPAHGDTAPSRVRPLLAWIATFLIVTYGWLFFRAANLSEVWHYTAVLLEPWRNPRPELIDFKAALLIVTLTVASIVGRPVTSALASLRERTTSPAALLLVNLLRPALYFTMIVAILSEQKGSQGFVYLQF